MMMAPDLHTPLQSLLLFQTLHPFSDNVHPSFAKISESLKSNELLRDSDTLDRLDPDSLKDLYLRLLKEEVRIQARRQSNDAQQNPRKRKLSSPPLETLDEALQYQHLLPQLVNRLYFRYRDYAIKSIEDEERNYRSLQKENQGIEREELQSRSQHQETPTRPDSRGVPSIQALLRYDDEGAKPRANLDTRPESSHDQQRGSRAGSLAAVAVPNGYAQSPRIPSSGEAYKDHDNVQKPGSADNGVPFLPPPQHLAHGYPVGSPTSDINRRLPPLNQSQPHPAPLPSPRSSQATLPRPERSSGSPRFLPPIQGMLRSSGSGSPTGPLDALADAAGQQYRTSPAMPSPRPVQQHSHQLPPPQNYMQQRSYGYYDTQSPYQGAYQPYGQGYNSHHGGSQAYQESVPSPNIGSPYGNGPHYQSPLPPYPQYSGYPQAPGYYHQTPVQNAYARSQPPRYPEQYTPLSNTAGRQRPPKPSPIVTSVSSTRWKDVTPGSVRQPSPVRPGTISPISDRALSPSPEVAKTRPKGIRNRKSQPAPNESPMETSGVRSTRGGQPRGGWRRGRAGRAGSVASSTLAESIRAPTRSGSILSQPDELFPENQKSTNRDMLAESIRAPTRSGSILSQPDALFPENQKSTNRDIKPEPSTNSLHEDDTSIASHTADEGSRKSTRRRRGTIRGLESADSARTGLKRKREDFSNLPPPSPSPAEPSTSVSRPGYVFGTRNFARTSATIMNDIMAYKVANIFGRPLTERDAPGYKDLIFRPQDLKSIKTAINAGSKALVAAVAENADDAGNSYNVWIPETPDVVPPKGIVNSAQLEKELMRMFANAIMYNPDLPTNRGIGDSFRSRLLPSDPDFIIDESTDDEGGGKAEKGKLDVSVVKDTREMYEAVEPRITEWRDAERAAEGVGKGSSTRLRGGSGIGLDGVDEEEGAEGEGKGEGEGEGELVLGSVEVEIVDESTPEPEPRAKRRRR